MESSFQDWLEKILDQLAQNPFVGKPLGVSWFREKKLGKFRVYFLIYENLRCVYLVNQSEKKDQQEVVNSIKFLLNVYAKEIEELAARKNPQRTRLTRPALISAKL